MLCSIFYLFIYSFSDNAFWVFDFMLFTASGETWTQSGSKGIFSLGLINDTPVFWRFLPKFLKSACYVTLFYSYLIICSCFEFVIALCYKFCGEKRYSINRMLLSSLQGSMLVLLCISTVHSHSITGIPRQLLHITTTSFIYHYNITTIVKL
jgi:hypothetical protein